MDDPHWSGRLGALSITSGVAVSVLYLPQPLLGEIADNLGVAPSVASVIATAVQVGYALGILLLVPLADRVQPRRQVTIQAVLLAATLSISALLQGVAAVALGFFVVGLVANIAQVIIPAASRLSPPDRRGATTGTLVGALLVGIFGGRIVSSLLVGAIGWRWVAVAYAVAVLLTIPLARRALRADLELDPTPRSYPRLLLATLGLARRSPALLQSAAMQFFVFAAFNTLWTTVVLHLTGGAYGWTVLAAGLFGIVGLVAGFLTPLSGRFIDRFGSLPVAGVLLAVLVLATASLVVDNRLVAPFALSMFVATLANQSIQSANQTRALSANPTAAAHANTLFMFLVFFGGATGALLGPAAYAAGGMTLVAVVATGLSSVALGIWFFTFLSTRRAI